MRSLSRSVATQCRGGAKPQAKPRSALPARLQYPDPEGTQTWVTSQLATVVLESEMYSLIRCLILESGNNSMTNAPISGGVVHNLPSDLRKALAADAKALAAWEDITPLARNEWICWTISVKKDETRRQHVERVCSEIKEGMRRPCCWPGCPHR
jgi:hypothetical protein